MGKKVWLLLRDIPYWSWGLEGEHTFWYPSMRLFRQKERHNWQEVIERVSIVLIKEMKKMTKIVKYLSFILAPVSLGELIDKITILEIKQPL